MTVERQQGGRDKLTTPRHDQLGKAEPDLERFEEPQADTASDRIRALTQAFTQPAVQHRGNRRGT